MKVYELFENVEMQGDIQFLEYHDNIETYKEIDKATAWEREITFMYSSRGILIIEVATNE